MHVYIASDAGESVTVPVEAAARAAGVPVTAAGTMRELGRACGLHVGLSLIHISSGLQGYDHNFVLCGEGFRRALTAVSPHTGIRMECWTDQPGVQLYTAGALEEETGKGGKPMGHFQAFCAETQHFPDSPNHPEYPSVVLRPGDVYKRQWVSCGRRRCESWENQKRRPDFSIWSTP